MTLSLVLSLALMPPEAARHHDQAMTLYRAGRHAEAYVEFRAAYDALTDLRADHDEREQVLGSLRGMLLVEHEQTGAPEPLCRLQTLLDEHTRTLAEAHAGAAAAPPELAIDRQLLAEVTTQLAAFPADVCEQQEPAPLLTTPSPTPEPAAPVAAPQPATPPPRLADGPGPGQLRVAGGVTLGVSAGLLGAMAYGIADQQRHAAAARRTDSAVVGDITPAQHAELLADREGARASRTLAIATGCAAVTTTAVGVALFVVASKRSRAGKQRLSVAPWWLSGGAGVSLHVPLR